MLVVHNRYRSAEPSGENVVVDHERALLRRAGHEVAVFERNSDDIAAMSSTGRAAAVVRIPWSRPSRRAFAAQLNAFRPDLVHVHNTFPLISPAILPAALEAGVPVVATLHNYRLICPSGQLFRDGRACTECVGRTPLPAVRHGCYRGSRLATVPLAVHHVVGQRVWWNAVNLFFCISDGQRNALIAGGLPATRLVVKYNPVPDLGTGSGPGRHVLYVGRLTETKGVQVLIDAWESFTAATAAPVPLVVAGDGPLRERVAGWAASRLDVRFEGLVDTARCAQLTRAAVAVVAPSVWAEPFGLVAVEAMSAGVPVLASAHGAFPELVRDGHTGLLHPPGDAAALAADLRRILDPATAERLAAAARQRYEEHFGPDAALRRLVRGYRMAMLGSAPFPLQLADE